MIFSEKFRIMISQDIRTHHTLACIWDFDKTLTPGYMQSPLFQEYGIDEAAFWTEVNRLPEIYAQRGVHVSKDTVYLNHLLSYVKNGPLKGLSNKKLRELGAKIQLCPGVPAVFGKLRDYAKKLGEEFCLDIDLEHYIVSTGLAEMIRGSAVAAHVDGIYGCEFIEQPLPPHYTEQDELALALPSEISQIGVMVDNQRLQQKSGNRRERGRARAGSARALRKHGLRRGRAERRSRVFRRAQGRRFRLRRLFRKRPRRTPPERRAAGMQARERLRARVNGYGPNDYREDRFSFDWLCMRIEDIIGRIDKARAFAVESSVARPPRHLHAETPPVGPAEESAGASPEQPSLF